jgi:hypothetical protein
MSQVRVAFFFLTYFCLFTFIGFSLYIYNLVLDLVTYIVFFNHDIIFPLFVLFIIQVFYKKNFFYLVLLLLPSHLLLFCPFQPFN